MTHAEKPQRLVIDLSPAPAPDEESVRAWAAAQSVFVSGVIGGMEPERKAAAEAILRVDARAVLFEKFGGMDDDAEDAYLANVAASDIYLGVLGRHHHLQLQRRRPAQRSGRGHLRRQRQPHGLLRRPGAGLQRRR